MRIQIRNQDPQPCFKVPDPNPDQQKMIPQPRNKVYLIFIKLPTISELNLRKTYITDSEFRGRGSRVQKRQDLAVHSNCVGCQVAVAVLLQPIQVVPACRKVLC
jgi:hypothetical protein